MKQARTATEQSAYKHGYDLGLYGVTVRESKVSYPTPEQQSAFVAGVAAGRRMLRK